MKQKLLLVMLSFLSVLSHAQETSVTGKVTDSSDGSALPGVNVIIKGTSQGTVTDASGNFSLSVADDAVLIFSFVGYVSEEVTVGNQSVINVGMRTDVTQLSELVIIGYGVQEKDDLTGAVAAIGTDDFNKGAIASPQDLLVGRLAGVNITSNGGAPGTGSTIRIRGGTSITASNNPLIVVDGVPLDDLDISGLRNPLGTINPNDIETFTVLKDASSAAIYGARAANGVILITTKRAKSGAPLNITYNGNVSVYDIPSTVDVLSASDYRDVVNQLAGTGRVPAEAVDLLGNANTDWQDEIFETAVGTEHNLALSGSYFDVPFRLSLNYTDQDGILKTSNFQRTALSLNLNPSLLQDHLKIDISAKGSLSENRFPNEGAIGSAVTFDPTQPIRTASSPWGGYFYWPQPSNPDFPITIAPTNPVALIDQTNNSADVDRFIGNIQLDYKFHFLPDLRANLNLGIDRTSTDGEEIIPANASFAIDENEGNGVINLYEAKTENDLLEFYLNYSKELGSSKFDILGGYSWQNFYVENNDEVFNGEKSGIKDSLNVDKGESYLVSFYGRINYSFKDKYLLTSTIRRDGASRFVGDNQWGTFISTALAWKIKEEPFLRDVDFLSALKLRVGYGETAQENLGINRYPALARVSFSGPRARYQLGNQFFNTIRFEGFDANLRWEETTTYNAGLDFGFLDDRITGSFEYYYKETDDLLSIIPIPQGTNFTNEILTNVGSLENKGFEIAVNAVVINQNDFRWDAGVNFTWNDNEITKLTSVNDPNFLGNLVGGIGGGVGNTIQVNSVGHSANTFFVYEQVYDERGAPIEGLYVDQNEDGIINDFDRIRYKDPAADIFMGFSSAVSYKKFDFSFNARMNLNNFVYNNVASQNGQFSNVYNSTGYLNNVSPAVYGTNFSNPQYLSSHYIEDASFFRMDNMTLGYDFGNVGSEKLRLYTNFTVQNVFVIDDYSGLDPEVDGGIDNNFYPRPRTFLLGVRLNFQY